MQFDAFCRAHGLIVDSLIAGRWVRVPTVDHPRKKNGAYKFLGDIGWVQNHATNVDVSTWRPDADAPKIDTQAIANKAAEFERRMVDGWARAAKKAEALIREAKQMPHPYLQNKGFKDAKGLVLADESLVIPMRHWKTNAVQGAQLIRWNSDERRFEKKMLPGMRAKGAVFRIGSTNAARTWLVEGFATGLSVEAAVRLLNLRDSVVVCFSVGNLIHVAPQISGELFAFADNDESGAGEAGAKKAGLRYCMSGTVGHDANDMHKKEGIFRVASLMVDATQSEPVS
jgi:putative DNA primase/helicase